MRKTSFFNRSRAGRLTRLYAQRREWDSNPRWPGWTTTVFETAPFNRSGISPVERSNYTMKNKRRTGLQLHGCVEIRVGHLGNPGIFQASLERPGLLRLPVDE